MNTLFEALGGKESVKLVVDKFYQRVLDDNRIKHFFDGVDMVKQKAHQTAFLTYAFGGTNRYSGTHMSAAHKHLVEKMGLNDEHFDAILENLVATLKELNLAQDLIDQVMAIAGDRGHRNAILNRDPNSPQSQL
ncbi:MAG: group 1 truncated hemoglobin [Leptolyngbyaceae bacterium]|nr:group 1 truncated hemoglobin [Leptolyngbyaceae bacterium]